MRFTFSLSPLEFLSGTAILTVTSTSQVVARVSYAYDESVNAYTGSPRAASKTQGTECSFVNAFKVEEAHVDTGLLECGRGLTCVEDETSSLGGRCDVLMDDEMNIESHRLLVACTFTNGTSGTKCVGTNACTGADQTKIGCGSCIGTRACAGWTGDVTVGENSCVGTEACRYVYAATSITIKDGSCLDNVACKYLKGNVGSNSCIGTSRVGYDGYIGYACYNFQGPSIGDNSCFDYAACYQHYKHSYKGSIGSNSCKGVYTCNWSADRDTGDNSCNGYYACSYSSGNVGYNSCNGNSACYKVYYTDVGGCLCNGDKACYKLASGIDKDYDNCPTAAPSSSPTKSPSASSSTSPTKSPSSSSSTSPTKSPSSSPSTSPTKSPSTSPSTSPTNSPSASPSTSPSTSPTKSPSTSPTNSPSASPSTSPTNSPSASPSTSPTNSPSASSSTSPTNSPSSSTSTSPTKSPSSSPSSSSPTSLRPTTASKTGKNTKTTRK